ncbi:MAG: response regulator transcription factor [Candidatus Melainabacteria bacterium]|nr:response regulator transcription factor [Candidatus Melainabacteria bacterium]
MAKILLVEDDQSLAKLVRNWLSLDHHVVETVEDGEEALHRLKVSEFDLVVLDWNLPKLEGVEVLKQHRQMGGKTPVLMLTGKDRIADKEEGFDAGADDYLTKPFHGKELSMRIKALLRRPPLLVEDVLKVGDLVLERESFTVRRGDADVRLLPKEFALLEFLMRHPNQVFSAEALLERVWVSESESTVEAVTTCIKRLRRKLEGAGGAPVIATVNGVGYKLVAV